MASQTYVSLDLELIEANTPLARVIEIGAVRFTSDQVLEEWRTLVNPGARLPYAIQRLTGIDGSELAAAPSLGSLSPRLSAFVGDDPVVGQSIELDVTQLAREGVRLSNPLLDTYELATLLLPGLPSYDLVTIAQSLGVASEVPHRALADAQLARAVFLALVECIKTIELDILLHVNRLTSGFHWPYRGLFAEAERSRRRSLVENALSGAAMGGVDLGLSRVLQGPEELREPLVPHSRGRMIDVEGLENALSEGGEVATIIPTFEERPEQISMLRAVGQAFNQSSHLLVEAGTGTGKSLAYLLPSLAYAAANNRRVVVSTNTINLQDQLFEKDIPDLVRAMDYSVRTSVLKGRSNYLCLRRWLALLRGESFTHDEATLLVKTLLWIGQTRTGDRSELRLTAEEEVAWSRICSQSESCSPLTCSYHRDSSCFIARARRTAESSHLVIVNHALLLSDLATKSRVMPDYDHLIVDEAHHLEDEATTQLGYVVSLRSFVLPLDQLAGPPGREPGGSASAALVQLGPTGLPEKKATQLRDIIDDVHRLAETIAARLTHLFQLARELIGHRAVMGEATPTVRLQAAIRRDGAWIAIEDDWEEARVLIEDLLHRLGPLLEELGDATAAGSEPCADALAEILSPVRQLETGRDQLDAIVRDVDGANVCWLTDDNGAMGLHLAPLNVAPHIRRWLLEPKATVVFTSATLSTDGSFAFIRERLGTEDADELMLGSPFDYERAALLLLPTDMPEPNQPGYTRRAADVVGDVAEAIGGRTLALFTSYAQLRTTHELLKERLDRAQIVLMGQGIDGPRNRLLQRFKAADRALLLGTASFWEGVDVVGDSLSALIIARLPFAVPTDPIFAARSEQFSEPFTQYAVPQAILRFKQGFGRLIRSQTDRGVVIVLDRRILSKSYGTAFLNSLPACTVRPVTSASMGLLVEEWIESSDQRHPIGIHEPSPLRLGEV